MKTIECWSEQQLRNVEVAERTRTYSPVDHGRIIDLMKEEADKNGLTISNSNYQIARGGNQVIGYYDINSQNINDEFGMRAVFRNSYDKSMSFAMALGSVVWVCGNGCVSGEIMMKRKHSGGVNDEANYKIIEGFKQIQEVHNNIVTAANVLKQVEINPRLNAELIGRMLLEEKFISTMQVNIIEEQMLKSRNFTTINEPGCSAWDLYNATTEALKKSHPTTYIQNHIQLHSFMLNEFA